VEEKVLGHDGEIPVVGEVGRCNVIDFSQQNLGLGEGSIEILEKADHHIY